MRKSIVFLAVILLLPDTEILAYDTGSLNATFQRLEQKATMYVPVIKKAFEQQKKQAARIKENVFRLPVKRERNKDATENQKLKKPTQLCNLFVSSSIPISTLRNYAEKADDLYKRKGVFIRFVLRGGIGGLTQIGPTVSWGHKIVIKNPDCQSDCQIWSITVEIDPLPFKDRHIEQVPALACDGHTGVAYGDGGLDLLFSRLEDDDPTPTGALYSIIEPDALEEIRKKAALITAPDFKSKLAQFQFDGPELPEPDSNSTEITSIEAMAPFDVPDNKGHILYPKGFRWNPLQNIPRLPPVLIFDGVKRNHIEWAVSKLRQYPNAVVLSLHGNPLRLAQFLKKPVYDASKAVQAFKIKKAPAIILKEGAKIVVHYQLPPGHCPPGIKEKNPF